MFSKKLFVKLFVYLGTNKYIIDFTRGKQPSYRLIYSLKLVELETLKTYIKINLANSFMQLSHSFSKILILFIKKLDISFYFCIDY